MALTALSEILAAANEGGYAVGYFEAWDCHSLEAVAEAAEAERAPVMLGFGGLMMEPAWFARFGIEPLGALGRAVADSLAVPAALILNEALEFDHAARGVGAGYNVVMLAGGELPDDEHVAVTRRLVAVAHPRGVEVQAELGCLPTFGRQHASRLTDPAEAEQFVRDTGIDFLAVSIGNEHLRTRGSSAVDLERLRAIRERVEVPLVIHGGSGLAPADITALVAGGAALFHVGTVLKRAWHDAIAVGGGAVDYQVRVGSRKPGDMLLPAKRAVRETVRGLIRLYGSAGRA